MKINEFLKQFKETPGWWLMAAVGIILILKVHLVVLSLPYLGLERFLLTVLAVLTMFFLGLAGFRAYGNRFLVYLVPLILIIAGDYLNLSALHLDVKPLAAVWITLLFLNIFTFLEKDTLIHKVLIPGILCGVALSVNYSLFPVVLSPLLAILLYPGKGKQKIARVFLLIGVTLGVFLVLIPLSFALFVPLDILGVGSYSYHHHIDWTLKGLINDFGIGSAGSIGIIGSIGGLLLALVGLFAAFKKDWKRTIIFIAFPLLLLVYAFFAVFAALGIIELYRLSRERLKLKTIPTVAALIIIFAICFPPYKPVLQWAKAKAEPDSRLKAIQWIRANVPKGAALVVPTELEMNLTLLRDDYNVYMRDFKQLKETTFDGLAMILKDPYFLAPTFAVYGASRADGVDCIDGLTTKDLKLLEAFKNKSRVEVFWAGNNVLRNFYRTIPDGNPAISIGCIEMGAQKEQAAQTTSDSLIPYPAVWNAHAALPENTSPAMITFFEKGKFAYHFAAKETGNVLELESLAADEKGLRQIGFGFELNRKGFAIAKPEGKYIYMVVNAAVSSHLSREDNYMFISTLTDGWEGEKQFFSGLGWQTYILAKKIQPGASRLIIGFRFTPQSVDDRLSIRHVSVYVSENSI